MKLHKEGRKAVVKEAKEEEEEEGSPLCKELHPKQRRDRTFLKATNSEPAMGTPHLLISSPTAPHTHLSSPLPIINDPLDEVLSLNLNLDEHFEHMDLDISHISPTLEHTNEIILHPTKKFVEPVYTPSFSPIITFPTKESTHWKSLATKKHIKHQALHV